MLKCLIIIKYQMNYIMDINRIIKRESFFVNEIKRSDALGGIILMLHLHFIFSEYSLDNN